MKLCLGCSADISHTQKRTKYCNRLCWQLVKYPKQELSCLNCTKPLTSSKKFCDRSCSATYNNAQRTGRLGLRCPTCNKTVQRKGNSKYCSASCRQDTQVKLWLLGKYDPTVKAGLAQFFRQWLIKEANFKCTNCGWGKVNSKTGNVPLTVDHIDGNYKNNRRENLRVLCPNCHSLTPNYGALNRGNGREYRYLLKLPL